MGVKVQVNSSKFKIFEWAGEYMLVFIKVIIVSSGLHCFKFFVNSFYFQSATSRTDREWTKY